MDHYICISRSIHVSHLNVYAEYIKHFESLSRKRRRSIFAAFLKLGPRCMMIPRNVLAVSVLNSENESKVLQFGYDQGSMLMDVVEELADLRIEERF